LGRPKPRSESLTRPRVRLPLKWPASVTGSSAPNAGPPAPGSKYSFGSPFHHARRSMRNTRAPGSSDQRNSAVLVVDPCQVYRAISRDEANHQQCITGAHPRKCQTSTASPAEPGNSQCIRDSSSDSGTTIFRVARGFWIPIGRIISILSECYGAIEALRRRSSHPRPRMPAPDAPIARTRFRTLTTRTPRFARTCDRLPER
jgi:hypothetical protein